MASVRPMLSSFGLEVSAALAKTQARRTIDKSMVVSETGGNDL